jgi:hypothetical protein
MRTSTATLLIASLMAVSSAGPARAALTQVNVRIEGRSKALFEGPILTEGHDVSSDEADGGNAVEDLAEHPCGGINPNDPENTAPGPTPTAASVDAMNTIGEANAMAGQWYGSFDDYYVMQWGQEEENAEAGSGYWGVLVNDVFTSVGGCQYELSAGDEVLWIYNAFDSRPILGLFATSEHYGSGARPLTAQAQLDRPFEVEVDAYGAHGEGQPPPTPERTPKDTAPYEGARVSPVSTSEKGFETVQTESPEAVSTNSEGKASITFTTPGWHRLMAGTPLDEKGEEAAIRSNRLDVCVPGPVETGCGALPTEDEVRTPPRYQRKPAPEAQHEEQEHHEETHTGRGSATGNQTPSGQGGSTSGSVPAAKSPAAPVQRKSSSSARLAGASISPARLLLKLTAPGVATVKIARQLGRGHHRRWQTVKTITVKAGKAGVLEVKPPRLAAGSYRVSISLAGAKTVVKTLTVPSERR